MNTKPQLNYFCWLLLAYKINNNNNNNNDDDRLLAIWSNISFHIINYYILHVDIYHFS